MNNMSESRQAIFNSCCRLCLSDTMENLKLICNESVDDRGLQQKILASLGIAIMADDKLSTMVCYQCIEKVNNWQSFKVSCCENQTKLEQWMQMSNAADLTEGHIQIKEEPVDRDTSSEVVIVMNGDITMKPEPMEEEYNELPPPLTPQGTEDGDVEVLAHSPSSQLTDDDPNNPRRCPLCGKHFSSIGNRKKHEKTIHGIKSYGSASESDIGSLSQDERSQSSVDSQMLNESTTEPKEPSPEEKKILFAAGLKLLQKNSVPISSENLSRIELSYIEKCKAMVTMYNTLNCACHNVNHPNLKGLLSHLRALRIWFPVFTCYHCMITFTDRSSSTRHYLRCPRTGLETLIRLSNLKKRSEVKTRLYQNYKCTQCRFMYSFHEDFCTHVDEDHSDVDLPYRCSCGRFFTSLEDYKDHAYISCLVEFYCDICFITVRTLDAFQKHAAEVHDNSEGFILLQDDNYKQRRFGTPAPKSITRGVKREYTDESNIVSGKRRTSYKPPIIEPDEDEEGKVLNPAHMQKIPGTTCPVCSREYSTNNNMWRHYKSHFIDGKEQENEGEILDQEVDNSIYCCPDCGGMFNTKEWEKHKGMHKKKSCNECGKVFQFQSELDQHRSVHLNLKLYRDSKTQNYKSTMLSPNNDSGSNIVLMCEVCDQMFTSKEQLKEHKMTHEAMPVLDSIESGDDDDKKNKKFSCKPCNKQYAGYGGLWDHNKKKHPEIKSPYHSNFPKKCKYCDKVFVTGGSYYMHKQMHERNNQAKRNVDPPNLQVFTEEETNEDDAESYHTCKRCFKVFSTRSNLKNHMKSHGNPTNKSTKKSTKKVWCNICHCAFDSSASLQRHKEEGHGNDNEDSMPTLSDEQSEVDFKSDIKVPFVFTCDVCVQTFTTKNALKKHKEKHAREIKPMFKNNKEPLVYCKYCKISFANPFQLSNHMKDEHMEAPKPVQKKEKPKSFGCKLCGKTFNSSPAMYAHQGWHKRGKYGNQQQTAAVKIKEEPKMEAKYQCGTCSAILPNDTALQIHILERHRNVNTTVLPARCGMCNLDFGSQDEYEQHKRFHAMVEKQPKNKTFGCTQCPAGFSKAEMLKTHVRQFHREHQEHRCHYCDRVFEKANSLGIHLKVHEKQKQFTGGKPSPNTNKPTTSVRPVSMPATIARPLPSPKPVTGTKPLYSCSICNQGFDLPKDLRTHTIQAHPF